MRAPLYASFTAVLTLGLALAWPAHVGLLVTLVLVAAFAFGLWGTLSLRSGIWCRALWRGSPASGAIALTYDDGPDPQSTPPLLDLLAERGVRATFFCVGEKVRAHPDLVQRIAREGHEIGNHGDVHSSWINFLPAQRLKQDLRRCQDAIEAAIGFKPRYFRPPHGLANHATAAVTQELGLEVVGWQVRGLDMPDRTPERVSKRVLEGVRAGGVVLLHDGDRSPELVVGSTRAVLDGLEPRGLHAVGLRELLER